MIQLLAKFFIKDYKNFDSPSVKRKYGILSGALGIFFNILLFACKFICAIITNSISLLADAFNNLSDSASNIVELLGFKLSNKAPDLEHPFGHGRLEYIAGLIISLIIILMGFNFFKDSISSFFKQTKTITHTNISITIMIIATIIKLYMFSYNKSLSKKIQSETLNACAQDSLTDILAHLVVITSILVQSHTTVKVDSIASLCISMFIIYTGISTFQETLRPLLGRPPSKQFVSDIQTELLKHKPIIGMHDLIVHDYGANNKMISLHAEMPGNMDLFTSHNIVDQAEQSISKKFNCNVVIHIDPVDTKDKHLVELKQKLTKIILSINPNLQTHDIHLITCKNSTKLIFDLVKPFDKNISDDYLIETIKSEFAKIEPNLTCIITVESPLS